MDQLRNAIASLDLQYKLGMDKQTAIDMTTDIFKLSDKEKEMMVEAVKPTEVVYIADLQAILTDIERLDFYLSQLIAGYNREISTTVKRIIRNARDLNTELN